MTPDTLQKAAEQAQALSQMNSHALQQLGVSFVLGSFTSAWWTLREGKRRPKAGEVVSSAIVSGMVSLAVVALLLDYNITFGRLVFVSIMCGFGGDVLVRVMARGFVNFVRAFIRTVVTTTDKELHDDEDKNTRG